MKCFTTVLLLLSVIVARAQAIDEEEGDMPRLRAYDSTYGLASLVTRDLSRSQERKYRYTDPVSLVGQQITFLQRNRGFKGGEFTKEDTVFFSFRSRSVPVGALLTSEMKSFLRHPSSHLYVADVTNKLPKYELAEKTGEQTSIYKPTLYWNRATNVLFPGTDYSDLENKTFTITGAKLNAKAAVPFYEFELKDDAGETITWKVKVTDLRSYDVAISGQLAKLRETWLNKNFYMYRKGYFYVKPGYTNILDGKRYEYADDKKWHCTAVKFLMNEHFRFAALYIVLEDDEGTTLAVTPEYDRFAGDLPAEHLYTEEEYLKLKAGKK